jgi:hypothetical protein
MTLSINGLFVTFGIMTLSVTKSFQYAQCHYSEFENLFIDMLNAVVLSVVVPS